MNNMAEAAMPIAENHYTLYYYPFSLYSLYVRYAIVLRGEPRTPGSAMTIEERLIDLQEEQQLEEDYLLKINPLGQVPTLTSPILPNPITGSLRITLHISESYPQLLPTIHQETILSLLNELHAILAYSLSFPPPKDGAPSTPSPTIAGRLASPDISEAYREALRNKLDHWRSTLSHALTPDAIQRAEAQATAFLRNIHQTLTAHSQGGKWIFGDEVGPTALDAHTIPFVARLIDAKRTEMVPADVVKYAVRAMGGEEWWRVTLGRPTKHALWMWMQRPPKRE